MLGFFRRHWRGEGNFWVSTLVISLLATWTFVLYAMTSLTNLTITSTPYTNITAGAVITLLVAALGIWQVVGTWRASAKARAPLRWFVTRWGA